MTDNIGRIQEKINCATSELLEDLIDQNARTAQTIGVVLASCQELTAIVEAALTKMREFELRTHLYDVTVGQQLSIIETFNELQCKHDKLCDHLMQFGFILDDRFKTVSSLDSMLCPEQLKIDFDDSESSLWD
jgi:hypothetical protein